MKLNKCIAYSIQESFNDLLRKSAITTPGKLLDALNKLGAREPGKQEVMNIGFDDFPTTEQKYLIKGGYIFFAIAVHEKVLPASAINAKLQKKIKEIELEQEYKVGKSQRTQLKEEIILDYLPRALVKKKITYAFININTDKLFVVTASGEEACYCCALIRDLLGNLPVVRWVPDYNVQGTLNGIVTAGDCEGELWRLGLHVELKDGDRKVVYKNEEIECGTDNHRTLKSLIDEYGHQVDRIQLEYDDKARFALCKNFIVRKFELTDDVSAEIDESAEGDFQQTCYLMARSFDEYYRELKQVFEGKWAS